MFVLTCRSTLPRLQLVPGGLARWHDGRVTVLPLAATPDHPLEFSVEAGGAGGYGIVLKTGERAEEVARYPSRRLARRQLRRLAGDAGWGAAGWLGRGLLAAALMFVVWFLFFVPGDLPALAALAETGAAAHPSPPPEAVSAPRSPPAPAPDGPAFIDDPAENRPQADDGTPQTAPPR